MFDRRISPQSLRFSPTKRSGQVLPPQVTGLVSHQVQLLHKIVDSSSLLRANLRMEQREFYHRIASS